LKYPFIFIVHNGIYEQSQKNGKRKTYNKPVKTQKYCIGNNCLKLKRAKETHELIKADPGSAPNTPGRREIFERDLDAVNGYIVKTKNECYSGQEEKIELPIYQNRTQR